MGKGQAKKAVEIKQDPKTIARSDWQRIRRLVEDEACHPDWGCALYRLHRIGRLNNDQREAGDEYAKLVRSYRRQWLDKMGSILIQTVGQERDYDARCDATRPVEMAMGHVIADGLAPESDLEIKRAARVNIRYREAAGVAGTARSILEDMLIDDIWPVGERGHVAISYALTRLDRKSVV